MKVAIQGILGSYHHKVAQEYFDKDVKVDECLSFDALVASLIGGESDYAVMAIENSIAGSIIPNYALIDQHNLKIVGEYYLPIHHCLMAKRGQHISDIKEVWSHPMALLQCKKFFKKYPQIKLVNDVDTAEVAKRIQELDLEGIGAIASSIAAEIFDLDVLSDDIQTVKNNFTRFFILKKEDQPDVSKANKASMKIITNHTKGSLATVLNVISDCGLNMTKIVSMPVIDQPFIYSFFVGVTFSEYEQYEKAVSILKLMTQDVKILGEYQNNNS